MFRLAFEIGFDVTPMGCADGENPIAGLPMKLGIAWAMRFEPFRRAGFDILDDSSRGESSRVNEEQVDVVSHRSGLEERAVLMRNDAANVGVQLGADDIL